MNSFKLLILGIACVFLLIGSRPANADWVHLNFDDGLGNLQVIDDFYSPLGITFENTLWFDWESFGTSLPGSSPPFQIGAVNAPFPTQYGQSQAIVGLFANQVD
jgi:hypothetical protein